MRAVCDRFKEGERLHAVFYINSMVMYHLGPRQEARRRRESIFTSKGMPRWYIFSSFDVLVAELLSSYYLGEHTPPPWICRYILKVEEEKEGGVSLSFSCCPPWFSSISLSCNWEWRGVFAVT
jgi:hypothetical protein